MSDTLRAARDGAVVRLTLARPPLNVLDRPLNRALAEAVRTHAADPTVAAIVLAGDGRGFSAGVEIADHVPETVEGMLADFHAAIRALWAAPCPTLAQVHGLALGGGFELALACDAIVCEEDATLGFPEIALGCYPPVAAAILPARVGWGVACELVLGGEPIAPARAMALGLVQRVAPTGEARAAADAWLAPVLSRSIAAVREARRALREGAPNVDAALRRIERRYLGELMALEDAREGVTAWLEKRPPRWRHA